MVNNLDKKIAPKNILAKRPWMSRKNIVYAQAHGIILGNKI